MKRTARFGPLLVLVFFAAFALLAVLACLQTEDDKVVHTLSFDALYDTLSTFERVRIEVKHPDGGSAVTLFDAKVASEGSLKNLAAPGYDGKGAIITITGFDKDGQRIYLVDRIFDGTTDQPPARVVHISPNSSLKVDTDSLRVYEGDTRDLPKITILPADLADTALIWASLDPQLLTIGKSELTGVARGNAKVSVKLKSDLAKEIIFTIPVLPNPFLPDSLFLSPESLQVAAKGASKKIKTLFLPVTSRQGLTWHTSHSSIALVSEAGEVYGVNKGTARIWAESKAKAGVSDSVWVSVSERIPVTGMRFPDDTLTLFIGGSTEALVTTVTPIQANPEMDFAVGDPSIVELLEDRVKANAVGSTWVRAVSRDNPSLKDSIFLEVLGTQRVDSVEAAPKEFRLYTGGEPFSLTARVHPAAAYPKVQWKSLDPSLATVDAKGRAVAVAPGRARIVATSLADSLMKDTAFAEVKQDVPELTVGRDTIVTQGQTLVFSPEVDQDYGGIAGFYWDVDGTVGWDDSASALKPIERKYLKEGEFTVAFYVRDGERNWDTVRFKVTVKPSPMVVTIVSPGQDTLVNTPALVVRYTVNAVEFRDTVSLKDGLNIVVVDSTDEKGTGRDSVRVSLDSTAPAIKITSPLPNQAFNKDSVAVAWSIDGVAQTTQLMAALGNTDGKKDIVRQFTDLAGNTGKHTVSVVRDTKPPKITFTSPKDSAHTKEGKVSVVWFADSVKQTSDTTETLKDGLNLISRKFTDAAGNTDSASVRVTWWSKPPLVEILSPSDSAVSDKKQIVVSWKVNGVAQKSDTLADLSEGKNTVARSATDVVGQTGRDSVTVYYDPLAPEVKITSPSQGFVTRLNVIDVAWTVNGHAQATQPETLKVEGENILIRKSGTGVATVKVILDTKNPNPPAVTAPTALINTANPSASATWNWASGNDNAGGSGTQSPRSFRYQLDGQAAVAINALAFTLTTPAEGSHTLAVAEEDKAGNWSAYSAAVSITVDKTPPTAPVVTGETPSADPTWTWTGGGGGNGTFRYRLDAGAVSAATTAKRFNPSTISDADHTLYVQESDANGNWSAEKPFVIQADNAYPTIPSDAGLTCMVPGSATDTVAAEMDSEGYRAIFDGKTFKGWWSDCQTGHSSGSSTGAVFKVDPNTRAMFTTQAGSIGGILMTNKKYENYELVFDIWPKYNNDAGVFNRSSATGKCLQTTLDFITGGAVGGSWGEAGFTGSARDYRPFTFNGNDQTLFIPGNSQGPLSNWTAITSNLNPSSYGCAPTGCVQEDWRRLWDANGWNEFRISMYGGTTVGTGNIRMKSWFRKSGASVWVPLLQDTTLTQTLPQGYVGFQVHGGNRFSGAPGTWYRNIKMRPLNPVGEPLTLP